LTIHSTGRPSKPPQQLLDVDFAHELLDQGSRGQGPERSVLPMRIGGSPAAAGAGTHQARLQAASAAIPAAKCVAIFFNAVSSMCFRRSCAAMRS
jgi:hypothetical protein